MNWDDCLNPDKDYLSVYSYFAYGLGIHSAIPLPEMVPWEGSADVVVDIGTFDNFPAHAFLAGDHTEKVWASAEEICIAVRDVGKCRVRQGRDVLVEPVPQADPRLIRLFILGHVVSALLHQRQRLVLHASAVGINGGAVIFLGNSQEGKSTLAAFLHQQGHVLLSDDLTAVGTEGGQPIVYPGFPQLKLWPDAIQSLGEDPEALPLLRSHYDKRARRAIRGFPERPLPLGGVFLLGEGPVQRIIPCPPQEAFLELIRHTLGATILRDTGESGTHFHHCADLLKSVPLCRLERPRDLNGLPETARLIERTVAKTPEVPKEEYLSQTA